jgi:predicted GNAT superfamily acetyltransferase
VIRDATPADFAAILALNAASVQYTSPLDVLRLHGLHAQAAYHRVIELDSGVRAFLLALREGSDYASPNYRWFAKRYPEFLYVDRIVVDAMQQGRGLGAILYDDLLAFAARTGVSRLTCEFDLEPPNPVSARFHARYGFREVGRQHVAGGKKQVSLQARELASV